MSLWRNRELLWQFTLRNIELRHKGSHLGLIWSFLNPLLMLGLYLFVFGYIFGGRYNAAQPESRLDYALTLFLGLSVFQLFSETLGMAPVVIISNSHLVKKVVFPIDILPVASVGASLFHTAVSLGLVLIGIVLLGPGLALSTLWLPVILVPLALFMLGLGWMLSAAGVFVRDIGQMIGFLNMAVLFASAVFYPTSGIPPQAWAVLRFNPMLLAVDMSRQTVMWHQPINLHHLLYLMLVGMGVCALGHWIFRKTAPTFADVI